MVIPFLCVLCVSCACCWACGGCSVKRFLALHRQLYQIVDPKAVDPERLRWVGVVDTVRKDRLGVAAEWPAMAEEVCVFDHHVGRVCDITNPKKIEITIDAVGAVATLICERLKAANHSMTPAEATLLALAIHSDTGSLTFEHTTSRDAAMLSWLMSHGAVQRSIAEFSHTMLTDEQQIMLSQGLAELNRRRVHGVEIGSVVLVGRSFLKGMSTVATDLIDLSNVDVLILAYVNCRGRRAKRKKSMDDGEYCGPEQLKQISVIGRARARVDGVDFNKLFSSLGGGGHARAASASLKLTEAQAEELVDSLVEQTVQQIPQPRPVTDYMTTDVITILPTAHIGDAMRLMALHGKAGLPVVDENGILQGLITVQDVKLAERKSGAHGLRTPVAGWMHQKVVSVLPDTPFYEAERLVSENSLGRLPVVDSNNKLIGLITGTDVLVARQMWSDNIMES